MADSSLSVNVRATAATLRNAAAKFLFQAGDDSPHLGRIMKWKDWVDEALLALQAELFAANVPQASPPAGIENADDVDLAISAGWDTGDTVVDTDSAGGSTNAKFHFEITTGTTPTANPTVTFTFPTALATAPKMAIPVSRNIPSAPAGHWSVDSVSTTAVVLQFVGTPQAEVTHTCDCLVVF